MRDIRARIAQRHGIELSNQQIQELAARRLESILDPRTIKPGLLDQLRKNAGAQHEVTVPAVEPLPAFTFESQTLYESHRGALRVIRRLLNPILKLFFNPNPLIHALNTQARMNAEAAAREAESAKRQTEWNALHYEILQRLVTEVSRVSLEVQSLSLRVESLAAKVGFNERRVRGLEGTLHQPRPARPQEAAVGEKAAVEVLPGGTAGEPTSEGVRRRRRRRRGRRSGMGGGQEAQPAAPREVAEPEMVLPVATTDGEQVAADVPDRAVVGEPAEPQETAEIDRTATEPETTTPAVPIAAVPSETTPPPAPPDPSANSPLDKLGVTLSGVEGSGSPRATSGVDTRPPDSGSNEQ
jgi:hypothetical protein